MDSINDTKLNKLRITHILSVAGGKQHKVPECEHLSVPMADNGNSDLSRVIDQVFPFIEKSQQEGNRLFIHCKLGQNRSPTVVIAWLMKKEKKYNSFFKAYKHVKFKRPMVQPHKSYIKQLRDLDLQINKIYSTPANFLTMTFNNGYVDIAHEGWSQYDSTNYIRNQLMEMNTEDLATYQSHQVSVGHESTYESSFNSSREVTPDLNECHKKDSTTFEEELVEPQVTIEKWA